MLIASSPSATTDSTRSTRTGAAACDAVVLHDVGAAVEAHVLTGALCNLRPARQSAIRARARRWGVASARETRRTRRSHGTTTQKRRISLCRAASTALQQSHRTDGRTCGDRVRRRVDNRRMPPGIGCLGNPRWTRCRYKGGGPCVLPPWLLGSRTLTCGRSREHPAASSD
jgi:hypothetical protein